MTSEATRIIGLYQRKALKWVESRARSSLFEKSWLDRFAHCCRLLRRFLISGADLPSQLPDI